MPREKMTWGECGFILVLLVIMLLLLVPLLGLPSGMRRQSCANNLKQMGLAFRSFAAEAPNHRFPTWQIAWDQPAEEGVKHSGVDDVQHNRNLSRSVAITQLYPEYVSDLSLFVCPGDPKGVKGLSEVKVDASWTTRGDELLRHAPFPQEASRILGLSNSGESYLKDLGRTYGYCCWLVVPDWMKDPGYYSTVSSILLQAVGNQTRTDAFHPSAVAGLRAQGRDANCPMLGNLGKDFAQTLYTNTPKLEPALPVTFHATVEGVERFLLFDIVNPAAAAAYQSSIVMMWDRGGITEAQPAGYVHTPAGGNILFMDGHVEFARYPATDPRQWPMSAFGVQWDDAPDWP